MSLSHLAVITGGYPSPAHPSCYTFVQQFAHAVARQGVRCTVIQPVALHESIPRTGVPYRTVEIPRDGEGVEVLRPRFLSLSARRAYAKMGPLNPGLVTLRNFTAAVKKTILRQELKPDALYGHFLYLAGAAAVKVGQDLDIAAFPAMGESIKQGERIWTIANFNDIQVKSMFADISGLIVNSMLLKQMAVEQLSIPKNKISVFPNGVDRARFYPREKISTRKKYCLPLDCFLVGCTGHFSKRKGQQRILDALSEIKDVGLIFIGEGIPAASEVSIFFNHAVEPAQVPELLSACDIFVLPTLAEGSSNAIIEAMSCGLPIVSSKGEFNDDLLLEDMSIRVDPLDVGQIRHAVLALKENEALRKRMAQASLRRAAKFDINIRARRILTFMEERA